MRPKHYKWIFFFFTADRKVSASFLTSYSSSIQFVNLLLFNATYCREHDLEFENLSLKIFSYEVTKMNKDFIRISKIILLKYGKVILWLIWMSSFEMLQAAQASELTVEECSKKLYTQIDQGNQK